MRDFGFFGPDDRIPEPEFWKSILNEDELEEAISASIQKQVLIFKHSERCSISRFAKRRLDRQIRENWDDAIAYYIINVVDYRTVSQKLAQRINIRHESPQLLVIDKGECIAHGSHEHVNWPLE